MRRSSKVQVGRVFLEAVKFYNTIIRHLVLAASCFFVANLTGSLIIVEKMSVPMGAHAAFKVRDYINQGKSGGQGDSGYKHSVAGKNTTEDMFSTQPSKYNEKMMMSIWGQYNRYSVHNMKSHNDFLHTHKA